MLDYLTLNKYEFFLGWEWKMLLSWLLGQSFQFTKIEKIENQNDSVNNKNQQLESRCHMLDCWDSLFGNNK